MLAEIIRKTDGIPLFVEELTKTVVQSGLLEDTATGYQLKGPLPAFAIPSTLQDSLMARLDRLAPAKEVAQVSALIGREFSRRLLAAVLQMPDAKLNEALDDLVRAELVIPRDPGPNATYSFRHALIRDTASNSMLKSQWVVRHNQIAAVIEQTEPDTVAAQPELLAHHYQEGGNLARAFDYWLEAGQLATLRLAHREAAAHYRSALALLAKLEDRAQADAVELELQMRLGGLLMQTDGYGSPQTSRCFAKARELASQLGQIDVFVVACSALGATLWASGRYREVIEMQGQLAPQELARLKPMSRVFRGLALGLAELHLGNLNTAWELTCEAARELEAAEPERRQDIGVIDPVVTVLAQSVAVRVHQGFLDQADAMTTEAIEYAQRRGHEPTRAWALGLARWRAFRRGDMAESIRLSRESLALAERLGFHTRVATGQMMLGRALVAAGDIEQGKRLLREGYAQWLAAGALATGSEYASHAAEVLLNAGCAADAAEFVRAGEKVQSEIEERFYEAELLRQRGRLVELGIDVNGGSGGGGGDAGGNAEQFYRRALEVAERQGAKLFSLRAAMELARLMKVEGRGSEGAAILRPVYEWFTEGLDYPELVRAGEVLRAIGGVSGVASAVRL